MALPQTPPAGTGHLGFHNEIHELLAGMDAYANVAGFASLQAAHDSLPGAGGILYFPPGLQLTPTAATNITKPCAIIGSPGSKLIQGGNTAYELLHVTAALDRFVMVDMHLDGRKDNGRTVDGNLLNFDAACSNVYIAGNRMLNSRGPITFNGNTNLFKKVTVERNELINSFYMGIYAHGQQDGLRIRDNWIETTNGAGIFFENLTAGEQVNVTVDGNTIINPQRSGNAGNAGIQTVASGGLIHRKFKITGNTIHFDSVISTNSVSIGCDQIADSLIQGNVIQNPDFGEGIIAVGYGNDILGNRIKGTSAGAIGLLSYGDNGQVRDVNVVGNIIQGGTGTIGNGIIWTAETVAGQAISGLNIASNRCYGLNFGILTYNGAGTMTCADCFVVANNLAGNNTAAQFVTTTGVTRTANHPTI